MIWKLPNDVKSNRLKNLNETSRRINRNLWNHLTINADKQTEFSFVKNTNDSYLISTQYLWNHWVSSIPRQDKMDQINELVNTILTVPKGPKNAVKRLNNDFWLINGFFTFTRLAIVFFVYSVKVFMIHNALI